MARAVATYPMKLAALIAAALRQHTPILCAICGYPIIPGQKFAFDHGHAVGRQGPNEVSNLFPVHDQPPGDAFDCHTRKTAHPRGPHTAIGGDTFEAAKTKRLVEQAALDKAVLTGTVQRPPSRLQGRGFDRAHRPMQSRQDPWNKQYRSTRQP